MSEVELDALLRRFLEEGSELIPIEANGRRTLAVYRQLSTDTCDRIIKVSRFDQSIYSVNKYFADHPNICDSSLYSLPKVLSVYRCQDLLVVVYSLVEYAPISWSDLRSASAVFGLARAIADFNSTVSLPVNHSSSLSGIRIKKYRLSLSLDALSSVFPSWSRPDVARYLDLAHTSYRSLLKRVRSLDGICACENILSHNDFVPKNILKPVPAQARYIFIDLDDACMAPVGADLRFVVAANYLQSDLLDRIYRISTVYADHYLSLSSSRYVSSSAVFLNAMFGYVDAWLNIHLRARSRFDKRRFMGCLSVCEQLCRLL